MERWKVNLIVLWLGQFLVMSGMTMIIPFLPLYIQEMGIHDPHEVAMWAGIIFAGNFVTAFIFQPIWGGLADRFGRKVMLLRSGFGMSVVMMFMGLASAPLHLLLLRMANGVISGFMPAAVALVSANTPRERMGFAMGTLQSGSVAGTILGPLFGGLMAEWFGFRPIFYITGGLLFAASLLAAFMVKETFDLEKAKNNPKMTIFSGFRELIRTRELPALYSVTFVIQFSILSSMPLIPLFVQELHGSGQLLAFYAGLVGSVTGFSNMIASPLLGRLGDRLGSHRILAIALIGTGLAFIPQVFVTNIWQLLASRFLLGIFMGGLIPSVQTLIRQYTPSGMESRSYSFNTSALALGNMLGPVIGGAVSGWIGIRGIFLTAAVLLLLNALWVRLSLYHRKQEHEPGL
ncbi:MULTISPECIES: MFS transporter [unclassified Paenibacillus]|uniref:MFS transporter n=1 Tax=unclassified Paenibacillus TaxID=185978 RepID=UPI001AE304EA|nr:MULTISPECIES: MFS transporter [unclassified Paenibacillus]MBP1154730.1 MFS family permease [Paenibacillus sp. PvP091]MBP1169886.1 MFS family permease [Paenibacillus sp. PvR098]MBP2440914.1 MFS family permease [Paenibacillus sp. PvP052]